MKIRIKYYCLLVVSMMLVHPLHAQEEIGNPILYQHNQIVKEYTRYAVSYNPQYHIPNWVAWKLTKTQTAQKLFERDGNFSVDRNLQTSNNGVFFAEDKDYTDKGYDRGHMCPAEDNRFGYKEMEESFYTINICPQTHNLNRGKWKALENRCRKWAEIYDSIYIVCGPILSEGEELDYFLASDSTSRIYIPKRFFKVVLKYRDPNDKQKKKTPSNRDFQSSGMTLATLPDQAIGYIFTMDGESTEFMVRSVSHIEGETGINFFPNLKNSNNIEGKISREAWPGYLLEGAVQ